MLLSYRKPATASSVQDTFVAANVTDENPRTVLGGAAQRPGPMADDRPAGSVRREAVQVNYTDYQSNIFVNDSTVYTRFRIRGSVDGRKCGSWPT